MCRNYFLTEHTPLFQLTSHYFEFDRIDVNLFGRLIDKLEREKLNPSFSLKHINRIKFRGEMFTAYVPLVLNFLVFLPKLEILDLTFYLKENSVVEEFKRN